MNQPPPPRRRSMPVWLKLMLVMGVIVGLLVGTVLSFNLVAAAKLHAAIAEYEADGETLDFRSLLPEPVPDEQNFCAIPELVNLADPELGKANRERIEAVGPSIEFRRKRGLPPKLEISALSGKTQNFDEWAEWLGDPEKVDHANPVANVLAQLLNDPKLVNNLATGLDRSFSFWSPALVHLASEYRWAEVPAQHIHAANHFITYQSVAARALLKSGDRAGAISSTLVQLRICEACLNESYLLSNYIGHVCLLRCASIVWDLCLEGKMSLDQLTELKEAISRLEIESTLLRSHKYQLLGVYEASIALKVHEDPWDVLTPIKPAGFMDRRRAIRRLVSKAIPDGVFDLNSANLIDLYDRHVLAPLRTGDFAMARREVEQLLQTLHSDVAEYRWDRLIAAFLIAGNVDTNSLVHAEAALGVTQLATTACRLEAHFAEHGSYPNVLADLPPGMRYERTASRYRLWLPGPDGEDDGGKRVLDPDHPEKTKFHADDYEGDWVWDYPEG